MIPDIERVSAIIRDVAATEIMPRFRNLAAHEIRHKSGANDLVTVADEAAERVLSIRLMDLLPGSLVVGEEGVAADPAILARLGLPDPLWIIDPVDGTGNFARGSTTFAVMVAHVQAGRTVAGWIYDPMGDHIAVAEAGGGTWLDGARMRLAPPAALTDMIGNIAPYFFKPPLRQQVAERISDLKTIPSLFCAGHEYLRILRNEVHYTAFTSTHAWDHLAGLLMHDEAGGHHARFDGAPYRMSDAKGGLLVAPDQASLRELYERLFMI